LISAIRLHGGGRAQGIDAVRRAYEQSLKDPKFFEAVDQQGLDLDPIGADELTDTVRHIYTLPAAAVERAPPVARM
jgi:hypothetical protein